ncbi:uncharacterized protein EDB91DRAFT_1245145 [Suillus paluster]|uniref:uncharacterized protein n=1 Tax=Suillus paluster TaxID=48578 RepID=UPI001B871F33|nr:uncharacterized protein EDB91DRAFT_1245145 [Suillus paluster]KAG1748449.1 hypothetical protein EDB91DRAFT_1245145 [Suillus paluster]
MNNIYDDMPGLVDADANMQPGIPPPPGATFMAAYPRPHNIHAGWNAAIPHPYPSYPPFPTQSAAQEQWARWTQYWQAHAPQPPSMPSPYIPHPPLNEPVRGRLAQHAPRGRSNSASAALPSNSQQLASTWGAWNPSHFQNHARPPIHSFATYPIASASLHTPASAVSMSRSLSASYVPPDWPGDPPKSWRRDFKFKSGFSSLFRSKSVSRLPDESTDSAHLNLVAILRNDKVKPPALLDLRRSQYTLIIRALERPVFANDLMQPTTNPPTTFMRLYHGRLPWYIDVVPSGNGSYVTLGDFFMAVCQSLSTRIRREEFYNDELDRDDREELKQAWEERCGTEEERMDGVKRVDFLRGKVMFQGLTRGKSGMWQLRTGRNY